MCGVCALLLIVSCREVGALLWLSVTCLHTAIGCVIAMFGGDDCMDVFFVFSFIKELLVLTWFRYTKLILDANRHGFMNHIGLNGKH